MQVTDYDKMEELENALIALDKELHTLGLDLRALTERRELVVAEYGFGGGTSGDGKQPATQPEQIGQYAFYGVLGPYHK
jgi:hypothetical protein